MAQQVTTELVDDLDGTVAAETVDFGLDGVAYEIDLSTANADRLRGDMTVYVSAARRVTKATKATSRQARSTSSPKTDRETLAKVRAWAQDNGHGVKERGRIPESVLAAYHDAQSNGHATAPDPVVAATPAPQPAFSAGSW